MPKCLAATMIRARCGNLVRQCSVNQKGHLGHLDALCRNIKCSMLDINENKGEQSPRSEVYLYRVIQPAMISYCLPQNTSVVLFEGFFFFSFFIELLQCFVCFCRIFLFDGGFLRLPLTILN